MKRGGFSLANRLVVNHGKSVHMFPMFPCSYVDLSCVQFGFHQAKVKSAREVVLRALSFYQILYDSILLISLARLASQCFEIQ